MTNIRRPNPRYHRGPGAIPVHEGTVFTVWQWNHVDADGNLHRFEGLSRPDTVLVLPVEGDTVYLARETMPDGIVRLQALGGHVEPGEDPEHAAMRELREEAGMDAEHVSLWTAWQPVNKIDWAVFIYWARVQATGLPTELESTESIEVVAFRADDLVTGRLLNALDDMELSFQLYRGIASAEARDAMMRSLEECQGR